MKTKQALVGWMKAHPIKAVGFAVAFTGLAAFAGFLPRTGELICGGLFALLLVVFLVILRNDVKRLAFLLVLAIGLQQIKSEEPQGLAWCAAAVIVVGGVATYCLAKYCSKKFPRTPPADTNSPPQEFSFVMAAGASSGDMAASASSGCDSCYDGMSLRMLSDSQPLKSLEIIAEVDYQGELRISSLMETVVPQDREDATITRSEFDAEIAQHGIQLATRYGDMYFGLNGRPATQAQVPIFFDHLPDGSLTIQVGSGPQYDVVLERSVDLARWYPVIRTGIGVGRKHRFMDLTGESQIFYRLRRN